MNHTKISKLPLLGLCLITAGPCIAQNAGTMSQSELSFFGGNHAAYKNAYKKEFKPISLKSSRASTERLAERFLQTSNKKFEYDPSKGLALQQLPSEELEIQPIEVELFPGDAEETTTEEAITTVDAAEETAEAAMPKEQATKASELIQALNDAEAEAKATEAEDKNAVEPVKEALPAVVETAEPTKLPAPSFKPRPVAGATNKPSFAPNPDLAKPRSKPYPKPEPLPAERRSEETEGIAKSLLEEVAELTRLLDKFGK